MSDPSDEAERDRPRLRKLVDRYRVSSGKGFRLKHYPTSDTAPDLLDKEEARHLLRRSTERLSGLQERLYAGSSWALLLVLQGMDAAGKDSTVKHVMTGVNPQGVSVTSFKAPGPDELAHDFLWRINRALPARGMIGIFNRSHYEEVLVARVHPELLDRQRLPAALRSGKHFWEHRLDDIQAFERHLSRQGTRILKFFLNVGPDEQKKRFLSRLDKADKNWKFDPNDVKERARWDAYMAAYADAISATATDDAPWFVVPADHKWFMRLVVGAAIEGALEDLDLGSPPLSAETEAQFAEARRLLDDQP